MSTTYFFRRHSDGVIFEVTADSAAYCALESDSERFERAAPETDESNSNVSITDLADDDGAGNSGGAGRRGRSKSGR